jgi:hypothetical protein
LTAALALCTSVNTATATASTICASMIRPGTCKGRWGRSVVGVARSLGSLGDGEESGQDTGSWSPRPQRLPCGPCSTMILSKRSVSWWNGRA